MRSATTLIPYYKIPPMLGVSRLQLRILLMRLQIKPIVECERRKLFSQAQIDKLRETLCGK